MDIVARSLLPLVNVALLGSAVYLAFFYFRGAKRVVGIIISILVPVAGPLSVMFCVADAAQLKIGSYRAKPIIGTALVLTILVGLVALACGLWIAYGIGNAF